MPIKKYNIGDIRNGTEVLPQQKRKTILFLSDLHLRHSGLGSQKKEIIYGTCHRYNYIDIGYIEGINPGQDYPLEDISNQVKQFTGVPDVKISIKAYDIYNQDSIKKQKDLLRFIEEFKPDALYHFTDPHSWYWMYEIQNLIRSKIPIIYYNIWDNLPYPKYNERFYSCSDLIMNISKQTQNLVNNVCVNYKREPWQTKYVPHGINMETFKPLDEKDPIYKRVSELINRDKYDFIFLFVNKNIIRKQAALIMQAFKWFVNNYLTPQQKQRCCLILKTQVVYGPGMPLNVYQEDILHDPTVDIKFISSPLDQKELAALYNCADCVVSYSTAEGFGLSTAEGMACGKPFIAPVIGGLQDQMRFEDEKGKLYVNDVKLPSNCYKKYTKHAKWVVPIWMSGLGSTGSMVTPYIYEMYHSIQDLVNAMKQMYQIPKQERQKAGLEGREWMNSEQAKMSSEWMARSMVQNIEEMFKRWKPRSQYRMFAGIPIIKNSNAGSYNPIKKEWE